MGGFGDVHQSGNVILAGCVGSFCVGLKQGRVIPGMNLIKVVAAVALFSSVVVGFRP